MPEKEQVICLVDGDLDAARLGVLELWAAEHDVRLTPERRRGGRRRVDRRSVPWSEAHRLPDRHERRRVNHGDGRRVAERRQELVSVRAPALLPATLVGASASVRFAMRCSPPRSSDSTSRGPGW